MLMVIQSPSLPELLHIDGYVVQHDLPTSLIICSNKEHGITETEELKQSTGKYYPELYGRARYMLKSHHDAEDAVPTAFYKDPSS